MFRPKLTKELTAFAKQWDRNIKAQGFLDAYLKQRQASA
jgi:hypothetical protein